MGKRTLPLVAGAAVIIGALLPSVADARPAATCYNERTACLSAYVMTNPNGVRYIPPGAGAHCQTAYQRCMSGR